MAIKPESQRKRVQIDCRRFCLDLCMGSLQAQCECPHTSATNSAGINAQGARPPKTGINWTEEEKLAWEIRGRQSRFGWHCSAADTVWVVLRILAVRCNVSKRQGMMSVSLVCSIVAVCCFLLSAWSQCDPRCWPNRSTSKIVCLVITPSFGVPTSTVIKTNGDTHVAVV